MNDNKKSLKLKLTIFIIILLLIDQILKIYIKTNFLLGEKVCLIGNWFCLYFVENAGMAYGMQWGGVIGKYILTIFRIVAAAVILWYIIKSFNKSHHKLFYYSLAFIFAGAVGNIIDSLFYGLIFSESGVFGFDTQPAHFVPFGQGYAPFMQGRVVDMLYFPIINTTLPEWLPIWGGKHFIFFQPIFNIADACITTGVLIMIFFYKKVFSQPGAVVMPSELDNQDEIIE